MTMNTHTQAPLANIPDGATHFDSHTKVFFKYTKDKDDEVYYYKNNNWVYVGQKDSRICIKYYLPRISVITPVEAGSEKPTQTMAELYPAYYKDVSKLSEVDVYAVHHIFSVDDPSGCIQHASKKLLLCGQRTGGKDPVKEIREARDTLTRKLQLMGVE